jgi:hypothetical protein
MSSRARHVTSCPLCGGILQSTATEPLTSADVVGDVPVTAPPRQCLICGYQESATADREPLATR